MSYETKLTSGNEADRNQSAMTATKRIKPIAVPPKANFCELIHRNFSTARLLKSEVSHDRKD